MNILSFIHKLSQFYFAQIKQKTPEILLIVQEFFTGFYSNTLITYSAFTCLSYLCKLFTLESIALTGDFINMFMNFIAQII